MTDLMESLSQANAKLCNDAYFAYDGTEIIEFHKQPNALELVDNTIVYEPVINKQLISIEFD